MKSKYPDTLEDLIAYAGCANDSLLLIHNELETNGDKNINMVLGSLYGVIMQINWTCEEMSRQVDKLRPDVLQMIAEKGNNDEKS